MAVVTKTRTYTTSGTLTAAYYNADRDEIIAGVNSIVNAQVATGAAIVYSKLSLTGSIVDADVGATAAIAASKLDATVLETDTAQTITGVKIFGVATKTTLKADTDGATITFDLNVANVHTVTLGGNRTLALSNATVGQAFIIRLVQDGTGSRTVTWWSTIKWPSGTAPTLTTTASSVDVFGFICTASGQYDGYYTAFDVR